MFEKDKNFPSNETIGIIGCGHLGRTIASTLIKNGFPKERIMVSYGGNLSTYENIKNAGLNKNIKDNEEICQKSTLIFIAVKPPNFEELINLPFKKDSMVVSCMAGVSSDSLKKALNISISRMMPSGPDTIKENCGIAAIYPENNVLKNILSYIGFKVHELPDEELMHIFTVGVCLPAALLLANKKRLNTFNAIKSIKEEYAGFNEIYTWASEILPDFDSDEELEKYIKEMSTEGGITEAITDSLNSGDTFLYALRKGIARSKELSTMINLKI